RPAPRTWTSDGPSPAVRFRLRARAASPGPKAPGAGSPGASLRSGRSAVLIRRGGAALWRLPPLRLGNLPRSRSGGSPPAVGIRPGPVSAGPPLRVSPLPEEPPLRVVDRIVDHRRHDQEQHDAA